VIAEVLHAGAPAAGWLVAGTLGCLLGAARLRDRRRTECAGAAMHELRRPLSAIALGAGAGPCGPEQAELALAALDDVERAVCGEPPELRLRPCDPGPLVERAVERWRPVAGGGNGSGPGIELRWEAGRALVLADARRLAQALDNLLANSIEHGRAPVTVSAQAWDGRLRLTVRNRTVSGAAGRGAPGPLRRGCGLSIVAAIATVHGGRFLFDRDAEFATGTLEVPLASAGAADWAPAPAERRPLALATRPRDLDGRVA